VNITSVVVCRNEVIDIYHASLASMGELRGTPAAQHGVGRFTIGHSGDTKFNSADIIVWQNTAGVAGSFQWIGWSNADILYKTITVSVWLKFLAQVPSAKDDFGLKVYGVTHNDFTKDCRPNVWCFCSVMVNLQSYGDNNYILLIFDSVNHHQIVLVSEFQYEILTPGCI